jgi:endonuclease/exonuclease/phosphatase family metal-dependent hydrolase
LNAGHREPDLAQPDTPTVLPGELGPTPAPRVPPASARRAARTWDLTLPILAGRPTRWNLLAAIPGLVLTLAVAAAVVQPRSGPLALFLVVEELAVVATLVVLAPVALLARARALGSLLLALFVAGGPLFASTWISMPGAGGTRGDVSVVTWNIQYGMRTPAETVADLHDLTADIVALQELEPDPAAAIEADAALAARYRYRAMAPRPRAWGLAVLSRFPIRDVESSYPPSCLELDVETPRGPIHVIVGHPDHADIMAVTPAWLPVDYEAAGRDAEVDSIRSKIDRALVEPDGRLLVLGDFNTTPSEPEYAALTRGLRDTHLEVGEGPGWTWRPSRLGILPFGLIRIDLQLSAGAIRPSSTWTDCTVLGDHCRLFGTYEID